jgi:hypothetical protein
MCDKLKKGSSTVELPFFLFKISSLKLKIYFLTKHLLLKSEY